MKICIRSSLKYLCLISARVVKRFRDIQLFSLIIKAPTLEKKRRKPDDSILALEVAVHELDAEF